MAEMGTAMMGTGEAAGPNRALDAAHGAMANPLLDIVSMRGAKGVLINITGGFDMTLYEVDQAANEIRAEVDANANIILGSTFDEQLEGRIRVAVVATGIDDEAIVTQQTVVEPARRAAEAPIRRPVVPTRPEYAREPAPQPVRTPSYEEPRPSFANDVEPEQRRQKSGGGFNMFGWKKPEPRDDEPVREFNLDDDIPPPREEDVRDPALDEELEIPAFLRRQMNPR
jgi:cell division protein FtsZ